jgi:hypothetical protein
MWYLTLPVKAAVVQPSYFGPGTDPAHQTGRGAAFLRGWLCFKGTYPADPKETSLLCTHQLIQYGYVATVPWQPLLL